MGINSKKSRFLNTSQYCNIKIITKAKNFNNCFKLCKLIYKKRRSKQFSFSFGILKKIDILLI